MEVRKLYYEDCMLSEFTATVTGCTQAEAGWAVTLDATAFYPEGGGQACDLGFLGDAKVLDVQESGHQVIHICDRPLPIGQPLRGSIDWPRRFDLMQQHCGEHILSGLIHRDFGWHNVGFHVGKEVMEVDFDGPVPPEALARLEMEANEAIWKDLPLRCWYPSAEELPQISYRTKRPLPWPVRIVEIPGYDKCACCGIHVATTGQIGLIKILSCVKFHGGIRLEMVCGRRALEYMCRVYEQNRQVSQAFSAKILETGTAARRMNEQLSAEKFRAAGLEKQLLDLTAQAYKGMGNVLHCQDGLSPASVRDLADRIAGHCGGIAAVCSQGSFCLACHNEDVKELGTRLCAALGGKGGGKGGFFQGSLSASRQELTQFLQDCGFQLPALL